MFNVALDLIGFWWFDGIFAFYAKSK